MDRVDRLGQMLGALRRRVLAAQKGDRRPGASSPEAGQIEPSARVEGLRERIRERIRALPPEEGRRATRIFVESVVAWEFGEAMLDDPQFASLVDRVDEELAADDGLRRQLRGLLDELAR